MFVHDVLLFSRRLVWLLAKTSRMGDASGRREHERITKHKVRPAGSKRWKGGHNVLWREWLFVSILFSSFGFPNSIPSWPTERDVDAVHPRIHCQAH
jgi:hypothetical protein